MKEPVVVITLHRRYHELDSNIDKVRHHFPNSPVVLVWAQPEYGRLWFIESLQATNRVQLVVGRPSLLRDGEGGTSYPESYNLRLGLEKAFEKWPDAPYAVCMAADITPLPWGVEFVVTSMGQGHKAAIFHWKNPIHTVGVWHTNFFAVTNDPSYWPPLSNPDHADTLERQWGIHLQGKGELAITSNDNGRMFAHNHLTEKLDIWPIIPQNNVDWVTLSIRGRKSWYRRILDSMVYFVKRRSSKNGDV